MNPEKNKGFSILELLATVIVLGLITAVSVLGVSKLIENAAKGVGEANTKIIANYVEDVIVIERLDDLHTFTYKASNAGDKATYLSGMLELEWDVLNGGGDEDNSNALHIKNPVSNKVGIVNWSNPPSLNSYDDFYGEQAMYITNHSSAAYTPGSAHTVDNCYKGSLIIWYDATSANNIYIYSVDTEGLQSSEYRVISK